MRNHTIRFIKLTLILLLLVSSLLNQTPAQEFIDPDPLFTIELLAPTTTIPLSSIYENLPKIGIGVDFEVHGWDIIAPRTFNHPAPNGDIPTSAQGGYDLWLVGLSGSMEYDPSGSYHINHLSPDGDNFATYKNQTMSDLIDNYLQEGDHIKRISIAHEIQTGISYQVPYIPMLYTAGLWVYSDHLNLTENQWLMFSMANVGSGWAEYDTIDHSMVYAHPWEFRDANWEFTPFSSDSYISSQFLSPVVIGLYERDQSDFLFNPVIASSLPVWNTDHTTAIVSLREDIYFSNGNQLMADDVVNTYKMHMTPLANSPLYDELSFMLKPDENGDTNSSVSVVDNFTLKFEFTSPHLSAMETMSYGIVDKEVIGSPAIPANPDYDFNSDPLNYTIGAGPFKLQSVSTTTHNVKLVKVDNWWGGPIALNSIEFKKYNDRDIAFTDLQKGFVDIIDSHAYLKISEVENVAGVNYKIISDSGIQFISVNMGHPILGTGIDTPLGIENPSRAAEAANYVRLAISHTMDRENIIDEIYNSLGSPASSLWTDTALTYDNSIESHEYNLTIALDYLKLAGYEVVTDNSYLRINFRIIIASLIAYPLLKRKMASYRN